MLAGKDGGNRGSENQKDEQEEMVRGEHALGPGW